ncbi:winged helix-turn-helix transcriptional regulator [bacterium]|nr:winged helix-turn-helix transcriptional regulator [bacterium]
MQISFPKINIFNKNQQINIINRQQTPINPLPFDTVSFSAKKKKEIPAVFEPYIPIIKAAIIECIDNDEKPTAFDIRMKTRIATHICDELIHSSPELNELWKQIHRPVIRASYSESDVKKQKQQIKEILKEVKSQGGTIKKTEIAERVGLSVSVVNSRIEKGKMKTLWNEVSDLHTHVYTEEQKDRQRQKLLSALNNAKANGETLTLSALSEKLKLTTPVILSRIKGDNELKTLWDEVKTRDRVIFTPKQLDEQAQQINSILTDAINKGIKLTQAQLAEQIGISQWSVCERINSNPELLKLWNQMGK